MLKKIFRLYKKGYKFSAFTLAEILITLGIIGVVAALTIPSLIESYQKQATVTKLKNFYSNMYQAIKLSEVDNGLCNTWDYPTGNSGDANATQKWFDTYLKSYMKVTAEKQLGISDFVLVSLPDGTEFQLHMGGVMNVQVFINGYNNSKIIGKDIFMYQIMPSNPGGDITDTQSHLFRPLDYLATGNDREKWTTGDYACTTTNTTNPRWYCTGLIMYDNWKIADDYPW